jgi:hypothetical protein
MGKVLSCAILMEAQHVSPCSSQAPDVVDLWRGMAWQYGDSFLELLRLVLIREIVLPHAKELLDKAGGGPVRYPDDMQADPKAFLDVKTDQLDLRWAHDAKRVIRMQTDRGEGGAVLHFKLRLRQPWP